MKIQKPLLKTFTLVSSLLLVPLFAAQAGTWTGDGTVDDGAWNWNEVANWDDSIPGTTSGISNTDTATFGTVDNRVVRVDEDRVIGDIVFGLSPGSYTFTGETLGLSHGGTMTVGVSTLGDENVDHTFENDLVLLPENSTSDGAYTIEDFVIDENLYIDGHVSGGETTGTITLNI